MTLIFLADMAERENNGCVYLDMGLTLFLDITCFCVFLLTSQGHGLMVFFQC